MCGKEIREIVGKSFFDDENGIFVIGRSLDFVNIAGTDKDDIVFIRVILYIVDFAVDRSVDQIENFDTAVKMRSGIVVCAAERGDLIVFVMKRFITDVFSHNDNI